MHGNRSKSVDLQVDLTNFNTGLLNIFMFAFTGSGLKNLFNLNTTPITGQKKEAKIHMSNQIQTSDEHVKNQTSEMLASVFEHFDPPQYKTNINRCKWYFSPQTGLSQ